MRFIAFDFAPNFVLAIGAVVFPVATQRHRHAQVISVAEKLGVGPNAVPARVRMAEGERRGWMVGEPFGDDFGGHEGVDRRRRCRGEPEREQEPHDGDGATDVDWPRSSPRQLPSDLAPAREEDLHRASEVEIAEVVKEERRVFDHAFAVLPAA